MRVEFSDAVFCMFGILHDRLLHINPDSVGRCFARRVGVAGELAHFCDMRPSATS
jgi:hypothetical protein